MPTWYLVLALVFIFANGFFVAAEFAAVKVRPTQLAEKAAEGSARAKMARRITKRLESYPGATQRAIPFPSLALGWGGEPAFERLIEPLFRSLGAFSVAIAHSVAASVAFVVISSLHIIFGELAPKYIAVDKTVGVALWTAHVLRGFYVVTFPLTWLVNRAANSVLRPFGIRMTREEQSVHSQEELRLILAHSEKAGILSEENREIIEGVFEFSKRTARQIMVPRTDVSILSTKKSIEENLEIIRTTRHTRYPLCEGTLDNTIGLIHVKDLLLAQLRGPGRPLTELKRDVLFVPENSTVERVLSQFIEN